jgi:hypothetical protein
VLFRSQKYLQAIMYRKLLHVDPLYSLKLLT